MTAVQEVSQLICQGNVYSYSNVKHVDDVIKSLPAIDFAYTITIVPRYYIIDLLKLEQLQVPKQVVLYHFNNFA